MKRKDWITKAEEKRIIETYESVKGEIIPYGNEDHVYEIATVRASRKGALALITIVPESDPEKKHDYPRIFVRHSDAKGRRTFIDVWDRDYNGEIFFSYRNPSDVPVSDRDVIEELRRKVSSLEGRISILNKKYQNINDTISMTKPAGRKPHPEKLDEQAKKVQELIDQGLSEKDITERLGIGRATFYRMKKRTTRKGPKENG